MQCLSGKLNCLLKNHNIIDWIAFDADRQYFSHVTAATIS